MKNKAEIAITPGAKVFKDDEMPHILEAGEVGAVLELEVKDKDGNVTNQKRMKSESFVRAFLQLLYVQMLQKSFDAPHYNIRDTGNTLRACHYSGYTLRCTAGVGVVTRGIIVGRGVAAPTINDYALQTPCTEGNGANQFEHSVVAFGAPASDGTVAQFTITRNFANDSGGAINVTEVGLYSGGYYYNVQYNFCTIRDVIPGGILVPVGQTLTVNYRVQVML